VPLPAQKSVLTIEFDQLLDALGATPAILKHGPSAVEVMDDFILSHAKSHPALDIQRRAMTSADGSSLLCVEFYGDSIDELKARMADVERDLQSQKPRQMRQVLDPQKQQAIWSFREAALGLSTAMKTDGKAISFVEDTAVAPEKLRHYIERFIALVRRHNTIAGVYAHASVGCLARQAGRQSQDRLTASPNSRRSPTRSPISCSSSAARSPASTATGSSRRLQSEDVRFGALPGLSRGQEDLRSQRPVQPGPHRRHAADHLAPALRSRVRDAFACDVLRLLRSRRIRPVPSKCAAASGLCRKTREGTMCPSYMVTREEAHSTRGRANTLRLAMAGQLGDAKLSDEGVHDVLDLCLECRACKSECPVGVDVARFKSEFLSGYWDRHGMSLAAQVFGGAPSAAAWGSRLAPFSNALANTTMARWAAEKLTGIDRRRTLPQWTRRTLRKRTNPGTGSRERGAARAWLFADTFTNYADPEIGLAALDVMNAAGIPAHVAPNVCCGRPLISQGRLSEARRLAAANVHALYDAAHRGQAIVFVEPSCLSAVREDAPDLLRGELQRRARVIAHHAVLFEEFLESECAGGRATLALKPGPGEVLLHPHCHQAIDGTGGARQGAAVADTVGEGGRSRCRLLRHGRIVRLYARSLRCVARHRREEAPARGANHGTGLGAGRRRHILPPPGCRPGRRHRGPSRRTIAFAPPPQRAKSARRGPGKGHTMNLAWISLAALIVAITLSMVTSVNVGVVSLALAWIVGVYMGGMETAKVIGTFPIDLLINLVGITLLFGMANSNGTLGRIAARAVRACRGNAGVMPIMFFFIAVTLASIGPGNIATTAIMAPMAMAVAMRAAIPPFLMALMVGNGAQAGALSRFAPTGIIVNKNMEAIGLAGHETSTYLNNLLAHAVVTFVAYFIFGGWKLFTRPRVAPVEMAQSDQAGARGDAEIVDIEPFEARHWLTVSVIVALVLAVIEFRAHVGLAALTGAALLSLARAADEKDAIKKMPWSVILMVCGVTVLIGVLSAQRGMDLFTDLWRGSRRQAPSRS
jgi:Fe-S oxidoreductase